MSKKNFEKFINKPIKGAKKKEQLKQEKKAAKKEREAYFIEKKRQQRAEKKLQWEAAQNEKTTPEKTFSKPAGKQPYSSIAKKGTNKNTGAGQTSKHKANTGDERSGKKDFKPASKKSFEPGQKASNFEQEHSSKKIAPAKANSPVPKKEQPFSSPEKKKNFQKERKPVIGKPDAGLPYQRKPLKPALPAAEKTGQGIKLKKPEAENGLMPLNKYIAHGGVCSRRDAGELVKQGKVKVNGETNTNPAYKVQENDTVIVNGKKVTPQVNLVYILLNKPKDYITTADDPQGRKTVLDIVKSATTERIYPVGRLDRNTSGVLLLTNDGELAQHLTHPSFEVRKIYEAKLDKPLAKADFEKLLSGIELEDGKVNADSVAYADTKDKSVIGVEIHSGKNRVVRRMFEHLGYDVKGLDRVMFANLTKKNVDRGKWRFLTEKEVRLLKFFNKSKR